MSFQMRSYTAGTSCGDWCRVALGDPERETLCPLCGWSQWAEYCLTFDKRTPDTGDTPPLPISINILLKTSHSLTFRTRYWRLNSKHCLMSKAASASLPTTGPLFGDQNSGLDVPVRGCSPCITNGAVQQPRAWRVLTSVLSLSQLEPWASHSVFSSVKWA